MMTVLPNRRVGPEDHDNDGRERLSKSKGLTMPSCRTHGGQLQSSHATPPMGAGPSCVNATAFAIRIWCRRHIA
jgi:hypothetical protein